MADKSYIGLGLVTGPGRSKARRAPADVQAVNRFISSLRAVVEWVIAYVKGLAYCAHGFPAAVGFVWSGVFGGGWGGVFGCWSPFMNNPQ